jgi:hypothetical protein
LLQMAVDAPEVDGEGASSASVKIRRCRACFTASASVK